MITYRSVDMNILFSGRLLFISIRVLELLWYRNNIFFAKYLMVLYIFSGKHIIKLNQVFPFKNWFLCISMYDYNWSRSADVIAQLLIIKNAFWTAMLDYWRHIPIAHCTIKRRYLALTYSLICQILQLLLTVKHYKWEHKWQKYVYESKTEILLFAKVANLQILKNIFSA